MGSTEVRRVCSCEVLPRHLQCQPGSTCTCDIIDDGRCAVRDVPVTAWWLPLKDADEAAGGRRRLTSMPMTSREPRPASWGCHRALKAWPLGREACGSHSTGLDVRRHSSCLLDAHLRFSARGIRGHGSPSPVHPRFPSKGHLAMSEDTSGCPTWCTADLGISWV